MTRQLVSGTNTTVDETTPGQIKVSVVGSPAFDALTVGGKAVVPQLAGRPKSATETAYILPGVDALNVSNSQTYTGGRIHYEPWLVKDALVLDKLAVEVTTIASAGSLARVGIYAATFDWQPAALIVDAGAVACDSTGLKELTVNVTLPRGRYVAALNVQNTTGFRRVGGGFEWGGLRGNNVAQTIFQMYVSAAYGALDNPGLAWDTIVGSTIGTCYAVFAHVASEA